MEQNIRRELLSNVAELFFMNISNFDSVVLSKSRYSAMIKKIKSTENHSVFSGGVKILVGKFIPNNIVILCQNEKIIGVIQVDAEVHE